MGEHCVSQGMDCEGKPRLRIRGAIAGEPSGKVRAAKLPYYVVVAACGETGEVAFRPVFDGRRVHRMSPRRAPLYPCRARRGAVGGHDDHRRILARLLWGVLLLGRSRAGRGHYCDANRTSDVKPSFFVEPLIVSPPA